MPASTVHRCRRNSAIYAQPCDACEGKCEAPQAGSLWERDDEVFRVEQVYEATEHDGKGGLRPITLVKVILVEPMPHHCRVDVFMENYKPYEEEGT